MSSAREAILKAVARALPSMRPSAAEIRSEASLLVASPDRARPALPVESVAESFLQRVAASKAGITSARISFIEELPHAVAHYLAARNLPLRIALQPTPALAALDWAGADLATDGTIDEGAAVGVARCGIAEYGSLVFHSAADTPILINFLPATHVVAVFASSIVAYLEDYAGMVRRAGDPAPRNACLITGASGTTDIEGNLVLGAHGPRELHIVVIYDASEGSAWD